MRIVFATSALGLLAAISVLQTRAQQTDAAPLAAVKLTVKPVLCVVDERTQQCDAGFLVSWRSDRAGSYCLFNDFVTSPLRCWTQQTAGELAEQRVVSEDFRYWLTNRSDEVAAVTVEVLRANDSDRRRGRRARHVWDLL